MSVESRAGMGWVALIGPEVEENLSLRYLAASLEQSGIRTEIYPFNSGVELPRIVECLCAAPEPAVVAVSLSFQWRAHDALALVLALRDRGYAGHITAGGHFGTLAWQEVLRDFPELDSICRGEAEHSLALLASQVLAAENWRSIPGLAWRDSEGVPRLSVRQRPPDVDGVPWPDRRGPAASCLGHRIAPMIASRGCYSNCSFCCIATLHRESASPQRHRLRAVEQVADEMAQLHHRRGIEVFIFHDDNFFPLKRSESLQRIIELGDALRRRRVERFATVVKARPNDLTPEVVRAMREELSLVRLFLGVESSTQQGCRTLNRGIGAAEASRALAAVEHAGLYVCFNMLVFDPDATVDELLANMDFIEAHGCHPSNFGRVELYAGTPLLQRLQGEGRVTGDYLGWSYAQGDPQMERVFRLTMRAFYERNFSAWSLANRLQSTRFDVEIAGHFHPTAFSNAWRVAAMALSRRLAADSARAVRAIVQHVRTGVNSVTDDSFVDALALELRECERGIEDDAWRLEQEVSASIGVVCDHSPAKGWPIERDVARPGLPRTSACDGVAV